MNLKHQFNQYVIVAAGIALIGIVIMTFIFIIMMMWNALPNQIEKEIESIDKCKKAGLSFDYTPNAAEVYCVNSRMRKAETEDK